MRKLLTIALAATMLLAGTNASAQKWTASGGYSSFSLMGSEAKYIMTGSMPGFHFGVSYDYPFSSIEGLTVEPGIYFSHYGKDRSMAFTESAKEYRANYLSVPVNLKYCLPFDADFQLTALTGPRFNMGIGGNMFSKGLTYPGLKRFDAQWGVGLVATIVDAISIRAGYDIGLSKCIKNDSKNKPDLSEDLKVYRNTFHVGIGFLF